MIDDNEDKHTFLKDFVIYYIIKENFIANN